MHSQLEVFLQFFVRLEMPYSVVRGEQVILQADVFNYFTETVEVSQSVYVNASLNHNVNTGPATGTTDVVTFYEC